MNSTHSVIPKLNSLRIGKSSLNSAVDSSDAFATALATAIEEKAELNDSEDHQSGTVQRGLGYAIASLLSSGMENEEGMMMILSAVASQAGERRKSSSPDDDKSAETLNSIGKKAALAYQKTHPATGNSISSNLVSRPFSSSYVAGRSATNYRAVIDQFNVEENERYAVKGTSTYCNIYVTDVTKAMGAEVPHYIDKTTGQPLANGKHPNAMALNANRMNDWLNRNGATYGWHKVTPEVAQHYANQGKPAVTSWKNSLGHGHIQIVSPSRDGVYDSKKGVAISQAGRKLIKYGHIEDVYRTSNLKNIDYFVHD